MCRDKVAIKKVGQNAFNFFLNIQMSVSKKRIEKTKESTSELYLRGTRDYF